MAGRKYGRGKYGRGTYDLGSGVEFPPWVPIPEEPPTEIWTPTTEPPPTWRCSTPSGGSEIWVPVYS